MFRYSRLLAFNARRHALQLGSLGGGCALPARRKWDLRVRAICERLRYGRRGHFCGHGATIACARVPDILLLLEWHGVERELGAEVEGEAAGIDHLLDVVVRVTVAVRQASF